MVEQEFTEEQIKKIEEIVIKKIKGILANLKGNLGMPLIPKDAIDNIE